MKTVTTVFFALLEVFLIILPVESQSDSKCLIKIPTRDYSRTAYFRYCLSNGVLTRQRNGQQLKCGDRDKLKITNFNAFVPDNANEKRCSRVMSKFRYKSKENTTCLSQHQRDGIILPFLTELSGKTGDEVKTMELGNTIQPGRYEYKQIALEVGCETESNLKVDMCKAGSRIFPDKTNVSLYFSEDSFRRNSSHTSCYCYFKTYNTTRKIMARAFDIRLHHMNQLTLGSLQLSPSYTYWWHSGVLSSSLSVLKLSGLSLQALPSSVWIDVYGKNIEIICDTKPLDVKGLVTNSPQIQISSSAGGLGVVYIIIAIIGVIVFIIIVAALVKYFQLKLSGSSKSGAYKVDDAYASESFISSTYERGDDPPSPTEDSVAMYSKPMKPTTGGGQKARKGGESDQAQIYEFESDSDDQADTMNNSVLTTNSENKLLSHNAVVHEHPKETNPAVNETIYNHFSDHPDVVPTSEPSTNNIYDTTARATGDYSSLQTLTRQQSIPENPYNL